jgi:HEAT repeat protein
MTVEEALRAVFDETVPLPLRAEALSIIHKSALPRSEKAGLVNSLLAKPDSPVHFTAAAAAAFMGDASTVELLWKVVKTEQDDVIQREALRSLSELTGAVVVPALTDLLMQGDTKRQSIALDVLSGIFSEDATEAIRGAFVSHPDHDIKFSAAVCLAGRGIDQVTDFLVAHLHDESAVYRIMAAFSLARLGIRQGFEYMGRQLSRPDLQNPERSVLVLCLRMGLGLIQQSDDVVLERGSKWIASKLVQN